MERRPSFWQITHRAIPLWRVAVRSPFQRYKGGSKMADSSLVTYEYYGPAFAHGVEQPSINIHVVHDVEAPIQIGMARSLIGPNYFGKGGDPGKPVSIHYLVGPDDICQGTPEHIIAWQVGTGNPGTLGTEQLGYASMTRNQWLTQA